MGYAYVRCSEVTEGCHPDHYHYCIEGLQGDRNWVDLPKSYLKEHDGNKYCYVGTVMATPEGKLFLIEFDTEADNGHHRAWIRRSTILVTNGVGFTTPYPADLQHLKDEAPEYVI